MEKVIAVIVGWLVIVACILAGGWAPRSMEGWVALIVFGPIIYLAGEAIVQRGVGWLYSIPFARAIERHPSGWIRIGGLILFFLVTSALFFCAVWGVLWLYSRHT